MHRHYCVADALVVDLMFNACGETYESLLPHAVTIDFDGVPVRTLSIEGLLKTKQTSVTRTSLTVWCWSGRWRNSGRAESESHCVAVLDVADAVSCPSGHLPGSIAWQSMNCQPMPFSPASKGTATV